MRSILAAVDRISACVALMAGLLCGVLVFFVALPLALSSPFPAPKQGAWIIETSSFRVASLSPAQVTLATGPALEPEAPTGPVGPPAVRMNEASADAQPAEGAKAATIVSTGSVALPSRRGPAIRDEVDEYLWQVYQRAPAKRDSTGDFTWKDPAAAKRLGMSLQKYVIGGMDPDFREQLYHAGRAMDVAGIRWAMLSAFRDDYRQGLASGLKARRGNSLHGGSVATGGYGHGRAVDVTSAEGNPAPVWRWLDAHGPRFDLHRPLPGADPAHLQPLGAWHKLAHALREARVGNADELRGPRKQLAGGKTKAVGKASL